MKYIKVFEKFDQYDFWNYGSMSKIRQDIADMFIELTDGGYEVDVKMIGTLQVYIEGKDDWFFFDEIYDTVLMLIDYVESEFEDVKISYDYEEYNDPKTSITGSREYIQQVMEKEDKHVLFSHFFIEFTTGNKKL
jgi:hypothetical protein